MESIGSGIPKADTGREPGRNYPCLISGKQRTYRGWDPR